MGQAFDRDGNVLGEAYGETKREVFDKLIGEFKDAHEIRVSSIERDAQAAQHPQSHGIYYPVAHALLDEQFTYHAPRQDQIPRYQEVREAGKALAVVISRCCPSCADTSAALRKVREAVMTANAAIALEPTPTDEPVGVR